MTPFDFLSELWQYKPDDQYILIWTGADKRSRWFLSVKDAADYAAGCTGDVYTGVGLAGKDYGPYNRCPSNEITGIAGIGGDFDLLSEAHKNKALPQTIEQASSIQPPLMKPTFTIATGNGIQSWWLLKEPYMFENAADREAVARTLARWHTLLKVNAQRQGWAYEKLADLARLLRVPGTKNCKDTRNVKDVTLYSRDGAIYNLGDFNEAVDYGGIPDPNAREKVVQDWRAQFAEKPLSVNLDACIPQELLDGWMDPATTGDATAAMRFKNTWFRQRHDLTDQSNSGYDMALVHFGLEAGLAEQQIVDLIVHHRARNNQPPKNDAGYYRRSINKARAVRAETFRPLTMPEVIPVAPQVVPAAGCPAEAPINGAPTPPATAADLKAAAFTPTPEQAQEQAKLLAWQDISKVLGVEILKTIKIAGKEPTWHMHTADGVVEFDNVNELLTFRLLEAKIAAQTDVLIQKPKQKEWQELRQTILRSCIRREATEDETFEGGSRNDIMDYLTETDFITAVEGERIQDQKRPIIIDGQICVSSADLATYLVKTRNRPTSARKAASMLTVAGARKTARLRGSRQSRWALPLDEFDPRQIKPSLFLVEHSQTDGTGPGRESAQ